MEPPVIFFIRKDISPPDAAPAFYEVTEDSISIVLASDICCGTKISNSKLRVSSSVWLPSFDLKYSESRIENSRESEPSESLDIN